MTLTPDRVALSAANMLLRVHGERAALFVAERIGQLAANGDATGVAMFVAVARHMESMLPPGTVH